MIAIVQHDVAAEMKGFLPFERGPEGNPDDRLTKTGSCAVELIRCETNATCKELGRAFRLIP